MRAGSSIRALVDGPYRSVDELRTRNLLPASTFDKVRDLLTVSQ